MEDISYAWNVIAHPKVQKKHLIQQNINTVNELHQKTYISYSKVGTDQIQRLKAEPKIPVHVFFFM